VKIEGLLFALGTVFYLVVATVYWILTQDAFGTTVLALTGALAFLVAFYILFTAKRVWPRPEDRLDADIDEADPDYGFFSPHSWWPLTVGFGAFLVALGLIFAAWLVVLGVVVLILALIGWLFEYYRGPFAA